jgi:hypothetical protein
MQRFFTSSDAVLAPGLRLDLADGRSAQIVMAAPAEAGGQQFLAVTTLPAAATDGADEERGGDGAQPALPCTPLPLPYAPLDA